MSGLRQLLLAQGGFRLAGALHDDDDDEDDEDDESSPNWYGNTRPTVMKDFWDPLQEPVKAGQELAFGGDFGKTPRRPIGSPSSAFAASKSIPDRLQARKSSLTRTAKADLGDLIPNSSGTEVARYPARVYCGQYSEGEYWGKMATSTTPARISLTRPSPYRLFLLLHLHTGLPGSDV